MSSVWRRTSTYRPPRHWLAPFSAFTFDGAGNQNKRVDARGWVTTYSMDALNRVVNQAYMDGTRATFTFDSAGRQQTMQDAAGIATMSWDNANRQIGAVNGAGTALTYTLDPNGNRTVIPLCQHEVRQSTTMES